MTSVTSQAHFTPSLIAYIEQESDTLVKDKAIATYPCYQKHFEKTKAAINKAFQGVNNSNALILGVGAAQDIDLKTLAETFEKVRLVDIDLRYTKKALNEQIPEEKLRAKFELEEADLTGILAELSIEVEKLLTQENLNYNEFIDRTLDLLFTLKPAAFPYRQTQSSFVCSSLVSTQIVGTLLGYLNTLTQKTYGKTFDPPQNRKDQFESFLTSIIEAHLNELSILVSPSGKIYYADHFTAKKIVHINHPQNPAIEDAIHELGEQSFALTQTLSEVVQKIFTIISQKKWGWALPVNRWIELAETMTNDGTVQEISIETIEFREYQISSYVLKQSEIIG